MFTREWFEQLHAHWENLCARAETHWRDYAQQPGDVKLKLLAMLLFIIAIVMGFRRQRA